jgi:lipopolysaccharide/colanic/teichoic acid biosynthesis glycosyltransferase
MHRFYRPSKIYVVFDLLMLLLSFYVVLDWFPLTTGTPFEKYSLPSLFYVTGWFVLSYLFKRYKPLRAQKYFDASLKLLYVCEVITILFVSAIYFFFTKYSINVLITITLGVFLVNYILLSLYFAYRFAVEYNEIDFEYPEERKNANPRPDLKLDEESYVQICSTIRLHSNEKVLCFLQKHIDLSCANTRVFFTTDPANLQMIPNYEYTTIVQLERLNNMRNINKKLKIINDKLPDKGIFICCFETKSTRKKNILSSYPKSFKFLIYSFDFVFKRVFPKIFFTRGIYYLITGGKNRIFSKTEIFGRLYCFGFNVVLDKKIDQLNYVIAQRAKQPERTQKRIYGPMIRLKRFGKDGKPFDVYKLRTMHPYSEYLQRYIYERNYLSQNGKFYKDIRITTIGSFLRKYWLDELPMVFNLLKGEIKLVGVRPLSPQYYNLYSKELQDKRIKFKPGLFPPFYADMPHSLDEIQESEMKYLNACEKRGVFFTDLRYFFLILNNILLKRARSG